MYLIFRNWLHKKYNIHYWIEGPSRFTRKCFICNRIQYLDIYGDCEWFDYDE